MSVGRPARSEDPDPVERGWDVGQPVGEKIVENRIQIGVGRIPRLEEVVVEVDFVDRLDCSIRIRIGREQHPLCVRVSGTGLDKKLGARHCGHSLIDEKQRDDVATCLQPVDRFQCFCARVGRNDPVVGGVAPPQITGYCRGHLGVIVDGDNRRLCHLVRLLVPAGEPNSGQAGKGS